MIVTTSRRHEHELKEKALYYSEKLTKPFILRQDRSIEELVKTYQTDVFVVSKQKLTLHSKQGGEPFFYHPNAAMIRGKQFLKNASDPLIDISGLRKGMSFLDCTLGLGADSLIASLAVGKEGQVIGIEANAAIATIVEEGLKAWSEANEEMLEAMRSIHVVQAHHLDYLKKLEARSVDIVYFDPMFEQVLTRSIGINPLKPFAHHDELTEEAIEQARRVSKSKIILKDHWRSDRFEKHQFTVIKRKNTIFHYGYIDQ